LSSRTAGIWCGWRSQPARCYQPPRLALDPKATALSAREVKRHGHQIIAGPYDWPRDAAELERAAALVAASGTAWSLVRSEGGVCLARQMGEARG